MGRGWLGPCQIRRGRHARGQGIIRKYLVWIFEELPRVKVTAQTFTNYTPKAYAERMRKDGHKKIA